MQKALQWTGIILLGLLLYQIGAQTAILNEFPLSYNNDIASHMAKLHLLTEHQYNDIVPNWYNGFKMFERYAPGWYYFALPFLYLCKDVELATFLSMITLFILGAVLIIMSKKKWTGTQKLALYTFTFANPIALGNFIRVGRLPELTAWICALGIFLLLDHYNEKKKTKLFYIFLTGLYTATILSHPAVAILITTVIASFWFAQKEKIQIAISTIISILLTAFWWIPFLKHSTSMTQYVEMHKIIEISSLPDVLTTIITPLLLLTIVYLYYKETKKNILWYGIPAILAILVVTRLIIFIPGLSTIQPDTYNIFFILLATNLFLQIKPSNKIISYTLIGIAIVSIIATFTLIQQLPHHTEQDAETLQLMENVTGKLAIISHPTGYENAFYCYGVIYNNITTHEGWVYQYRSKEIEKVTADITEGTKTKNCEQLQQGIITGEIKEIIAPKEVQCKSLQECGYNLKQETTSFCLYEV